MKKKKGQMFSGELMLAYLVFTVVLIIVVYLWGNITKDIFESEENYDLETTIADISENLMKTPGSPEDWNRSNVEAIGLVNGSRYLNENKILQFIDIMNPSYYNNSCGGDISNYECNKHLTGAGPYEFYFNMEYINGSTVSIREVSCTTGKQPTNEKKEITMVRTGLLNNTIVSVKMTIWRSQT